ncbi:uncharacterized protein BJ212DRAFT_1301280 [Suillus subaureus]|uniref:Fungal-type protein kinase domain-containing protein n=1 Tax=Suillus subaureus TaxID=48587 RepID=A0A9P7E6K3_9AGAM|nr:uncharacterized protein BJ212DRAFT_1301280 [Suillus subaureus]KAG1812792.1 hypothetical protein BJ212DRAFT_1301280 [Suillus subaureus]
MPKGSNNIPWKNAENHLKDEGIFSPDKLAWQDCPNLDAFAHHLEGQFGRFVNAVAEICGEALESGAPCTYEFMLKLNVCQVHHVETKESFIVKDTWHNVISQFQSRAGLAKALRDCIIAHREVFQTFKVLHHDIHIGNLYIKTKTGNDAGGELGDWDFADCQDLHIVQQRLQPLNCAFPKMAEPIIPASSPMSTVSSLTSMPSSPKPFQLHKTLCPQLSRVLAQAPSWQTLTTDNESDPDAQQMSTSDPWDQFSRMDIHDDLKSFFYVIVIIMVAFHEASKQKSAEKLEETILADHWWNQQHWRSSAEWKVTTMKQDALWKSCIAPHIVRNILFLAVGSSYTPTKVLKISSVLNTVAATSELPEGDVQPEPINEPPSRAIIKKTSHAHPTATISTGILPTKESTITDPVANSASNIVASSSKHKAPKDVNNHTRKKSCASEKNSLADEGGKKSITSNQVKKSHTSDGTKKKSIVISAAGKKSGTSHPHCNDDEDYVLVKASISGKRKN